MKSESKIATDKDGENVPHLEITEVVLVHYNIINNDYQQDSGVLYSVFRSLPNKSFDQLLEISPKNLIILKIFGSEFSHIEVWFTDQSFKPMELEDKINITLAIN